MPDPVRSGKVRHMVDPVGFATTETQLKTVVERMEAKANSPDNTAGTATVPSAWRVAICPHDDYTYVGSLYLKLLAGITAKTVILFGVAHRARQYALEKNLIFDSFDSWEMPLGPVPVSNLRERLLAALPASTYQVHDDMQQLEHSVEAIIPFLQLHRPDLEIISILVPYMSFERMQEVSAPLGAALAQTMSEQHLKWGADVAMVISTDAVHYGDEDWGGENFARYGTDQAGYERAVGFEHELMSECLTGPAALTPDRIQAFTRHTVDENDYRLYKWTWCGRYSVPCGLLTALACQNALSASTPPLVGQLVAYGTSVDDRGHVSVEDIGMGTTAPAKLGHWVGYACIGYA